ncbi:MAG: hypothetical protein LUH22_08880 [Bacteroides sp.]|nr:hypothetical protein [Bacteroides sp.]
MTGEDRELLKTFEYRLSQFIRLHDDLKHKYSRLEEQLELKKKEMEVLSAKFQKLETDYSNLKTAATISLNGSDVKETKLRLSKLVREVDKCIALLNE